MHYTTRLNPPTKRQETIQCLYLQSGSVCIPVRCIIPQGQTHSQKDKRPFSVFIFYLGQSAFQSNALYHKAKPTHKKTRDSSCVFIFECIRCVELTNRLDEFHVLLSSLDGLQCLKEGACDLAEGKVWSVFIELDCGYGRSEWDSSSSQRGMSPTSASSL